MALECGGGGASIGGFGECVHHQEWGHLQVALESGGIYRWLWRVVASPGGFGEWGHLQVALESVGITRGFGEWGHHQVALECGGHLQVALESGGISRWLWRVRASPWALESEGIDC